MKTEIAYGVVALFCLILAIHGLQKQKEEKRQCDFLKQFLVFIQKVKQAYFVHGMIEEAIYDALYDMNGEVLKEGEKMYDVLCDGREEYRKQYMEEQKNPFIKLFLALCYLEMQYGESREKTVFFDCIQLLKQDVTQEIRKREKIIELFSGLLFLILFPALFLKAVEQWGVSNIPELERYYRGTFGVVAIFCFFFVLFGIYWLVGELRYHLHSSDNRRKKEGWLKELEKEARVSWAFHIWEKRWKERYEKGRFELQNLEIANTPEHLFIKKILCGCSCYLLFCIMIFVYLFAGRQEALESKRLYHKETMVQNQLTKEQWFAGVSLYEQEYKKEEIVPIQEIEKKLYQLYGKKEELPAKLGALQVEENIKTYHTYHFQMYYLLVGIVFFVLGWYVPNWILRYEYTKTKQKEEEEFIHFQTILIFLSKVKQMDLIEVIEWLEEGSGIYQERLIRCLLSIFSGEEKAFLELKRLYSDNEILKEQFVMIVDSLTLSDQIGLERAFEDFYLYRKNEQERKKELDEIQVKKDAMIAQMLAFTPLSYVIGVYLILPFLLESMIQLSGFLNQMQ